MLYDFPLVRELSLPHLKYVSSGRNYTGVIPSNLYHMAYVVIPCWIPGRLNAYQSECNC